MSATPSSSRFMQDHTGDDAGVLFDQFKEFQLWRNFPEDKLLYLACPFFKAHPDRYNHAHHTACKGHGFKSISQLNDHIKKHHLPVAFINQKHLSKSRASKGDNEYPVPVMSDAQARAYMKRNPNEDRGKKQQDDVKWRSIASACIGPDFVKTLGDDGHLAFPGSDFQILRQFAEWQTLQGQVPCSDPSQPANNSQAPQEPVHGDEQYPQQHDAQYDETWDSSELSPQEQSQAGPSSGSRLPDDRLIALLTGRRDVGTAFSPRGKHGDSGYGSWGQDVRNRDFQQGHGIDQQQQQKQQQLPNQYEQGWLGTSREMECSGAQQGSADYAPGSNFLLDFEAQQHAFIGGGGVQDDVSWPGYPDAESAEFDELLEK